MKLPYFRFISHLVNLRSACDSRFFSSSPSFSEIWDHTFNHQVMSFDLGNAVGDVCWSPYSSTVFAAVTNDGKVQVFDLAQNKHEPLCEQKVVKRAKLTSICFNNNESIVIVGDDSGGVNSLKLSPNLRKLLVAVDKDGKEAFGASTPEIQRETLEKLLASIDVTKPPISS